MTFSNLILRIHKRTSAAAAALKTSPFKLVSVRNLCSTSSPGGASDFDSKCTPETPEYVKMQGQRSMPSQCDVAIIGGGMVGLAVACALLNMPLTRHLKVAIVDSSLGLTLRNYLNMNDVPESRVSTVTPATISFFQDIGAWDYVLRQRHAFFDQMQVWDYTGLGYTRYNAKDVGKENLGCVVENKVLSNSLLLRLQDGSQPVIYPSRLTSLSFPSNKKPAGSPSLSDGAEQVCESNLVKLNLSDGQTLHAKLAVGADGSKSHVREQAGLKTTKWSYSQSAVICTVEHMVKNYCAWQRFLPSGPIAYLPIGDNYSNIVWTMSPDEAMRLVSMSADDFVKAVNHALVSGYGPHPQSSTLDHYVDRFFSSVGFGATSTTEPFQVPPATLKVVSERMSFPLSLMHAHDYTSKRVALVGDAAHTVHPLAGQGVNLGFGDASALAKVISEGIAVGSDIGDVVLLKRYEKERKAANVAMMAILDGFQKAYSIDLGPLNAIRAAAFHGAQYIAPLKRNIISYAMGEQKWPLFA